MNAVGLEFFLSNLERILFLPSKTFHKMHNELQSIEQINNHVANQDAAILYFYSDNCAPCLSLRPKVIKLVEDEFPKIKLAFVNDEKHPELRSIHHVFTNPTLILFFQGREYRRESKYISIPQLSKEIARPYNMMFEN